MSRHERAVEAAATVIARRIYGQEGPDDHDRAMAAHVVDAVAPLLLGKEEADAAASS